MKSKPITKEDLLSKINKNESGCWDWTGTKDSNGRGIITRGNWHSNTRKNFIASRVAFELWKEKIPEGLCVCHACDNPKCINPEHLWLGTKKDNTQDMMRKHRNKYIMPEAKKGEDNHWAKLTEDDIKKIRMYRAKGMKLKAIGDIFSIDFSHVGHIVRGDIWKHLA